MALDFVLGGHDHIAAVPRDRGRDHEAWQSANKGAYIDGQENETR
jgi:hypothetical protein